MNAHDLLALQDLDSAIVAIAHRRPRLPELIERKAAESAVQQQRAGIAAAQQRIDDAQRVIDGAEHESAYLVTRRTRLQAQLKTVIAPREAEALMHQIEGLEARRVELDDVELAALDEQAAADGERAELEASLPQLLAALDEASALWSAADTALATEAADLQERRAAAATALPPSDLEAYERTRQHLDGVAVARLEGHHCSGCHLDLSPAELDAVKGAPAGTVPECPQCGRFLVR